MNSTCTLPCPTANMKRWQRLPELPRDLRPSDRLPGRAARRAPADAGSRGDLANAQHPGHRALDSNPASGPLEPALHPCNGFAFLPSARLL